MMQILLATASVLFISMPAPLLAQENDSPLNSLTGTVSGYETTDFDNKVNFGLVTTAQSKKNLMDFNLSTFLSPLNTEIHAAGQKVEIPSNISLPKQKERVLFFTIRLDKPDYLLPISTPLNPSQKIGVLEGYFPFKEVIDIMSSGGSLSDAINLFTYDSITTKAHKNQKEIDFKLQNQNINSDNSYKVSAPEPKNKNYISIASSLSLLDDFSYFPVDLKVLENGKASLLSLNSSLPLIAHVPKWALEEVSSFPFSLAWGLTNPKHMLPLAEDFISYNQKQIIVDKSKLGPSFSYLGYKLKIFRSEGRIETSRYIGETPKTLEIKNHDDLIKIQFDIFAIDNDPIKEGLIKFFFLNDDIEDLSNYVTRYEFIK